MFSTRNIIVIAVSLYLIMNVLKDKTQQILCGGVTILFLCMNKDNIDNFNKKALYIMIREMTDVKTSKITQVSNVFRKIYPKIRHEVLINGHIDNLISTGSL